MRVTGGRLGGRLLRAPRGRAVRPTADRVRESLFARLGDLEDCVVLDLYAGSGSLGIEALSRGAAQAIFVERAAPALTALRANLEALDLEAVTQVQRGDVPVVVRRLAAAGSRFDRIFLDPPYASDEVSRALRAIATSGILAEGAELVVEAPLRHPPDPIEGLARIDQRSYGDTAIFRFTPRPSQGADGTGGEGGSEDG